MVEILWGWASRDILGLGTGTYSGVGLRGLGSRTLWGLGAPEDSGFGHANWALQVDSGAGLSGDTLGVEG